MAWGLLQGLGRGISQGAEMVNRGMAEDREVERQRMREASIEKRWKKQEAKDDARYADAQKRQSVQDAKSDERYSSEKQYREKRDKKSDSQFDQQMGMREKQTIESNLSGIMEAEARAAEKIRQSYDKRIQAGEDQTTLIAQMEADLEESQMFYSERLGKAINSYGPEQLKGTSFSYLLDVQEPASTDFQQQTSPAQTEKQSSAFDRVSFIGEQMQAGQQAQIAPQYSVAQSGVPEVTFNNLMKKWNTPSADSPARPTSLTPEVMQQQQQFTDSLKQNNIQSAYGAASLAQGGLLQYAQQMKQR